MRLTHRGHTVLSRAYGMADKQRNIRNEPDTRFALASATKLFTAVSIHQLAQRGAISCHERISTYLGGFPADFASLTLDQLLSHTSGLGNYRQTQEFKDNARNWTSAAEVNAQIMEIVRRYPPAFPPGSRFAYSNSATNSSVPGSMSLLLNGQWVTLHNGSASGEGSYVETHPQTGWVSAVLVNYDVPAAIPVTTMARRHHQARGWTAFSSNAGHINPPRRTRSRSRAVAVAFQRPP